MKRLLCLLLCLCLTGCSAPLLQRDYLSTEPHVEPAVPKESAAPQEELTVVSNRTELRGAVLGIIRGWTEHSSILVRHYTGSVSEDLSDTLRYATQEDPVGAYAVDYADAELEGDETTGTIQLSIVFRRSAAEIDSIIAVDNNDAAYERIYDALAGLESALTLRIREYRDTDFAAALRDYCLLHPETVPELPTISAELYPREGDTRILELHFTYSSPRETMRERLESVNTILGSAKAFVRSGEDEEERARLLFRFLTERPLSQPAEAEPIAPAYDLLVDRRTHPLSFASVYCAVAQSVSLDCLLMEGTRGDLPWTWNLLQLDGKYFALDLMRAVERGETSLTLLDRDTLLAEGYRWDEEAYPEVFTRPAPETENNEEN